MYESGNAPVQPGQTFGEFVVLSVGTGAPVTMNQRVVARGSVLYNWKIGKTLIVREEPTSQIAPTATRKTFSFFKRGNPKPDRTLDTAKAIKRFAIFR
jgi:hypothetical protein